jgi:hypothetical protein
MELQEDAMEMIEGESYYADYKKRYTKKQNEIFFSIHKNDNWFREKYYPDLSYKWQTERQVHSQLLAKKFFEHLKKGAFHVIMNKLNC